MKRKAKPLYRLVQVVEVVGPLAELKQMLKGRQLTPRWRKVWVSSQAREVITTIEPQKRRQ